MIRTLFLQQGRRGAARPRLLLLAAVLLVALGGLLAQRLWRSPGSREQRLAAWSRERLEKEAGRGSKDPLVHFSLARKRIEVGDAAGAVEALESALRLNPKFSRARATLGTVLMTMDQDP